MTTDGYVELPIFSSKCHEIEALVPENILHDCS